MGPGGCEHYCNYYVRMSPSGRSWAEQKNVMKLLSFIQESGVFRRLETEEGGARTGLRLIRTDQKARFLSRGKIHAVHYKHILGV